MSVTRTFSEGFVQLKVAEISESINAAGGAGNSIAGLPVPHRSILCSTVVCGSLIRIDFVPLVIFLNAILSESACRLPDLKKPSSTISYSNVPSFPFLLILSVELQGCSEKYTRAMLLNRLEFKRYRNSTLPLSSCCTSGTLYIMNRSAVVGEM